MKSKAKALQHFKVDSFLKTDKTVYKQAKSMCRKSNKFWFNCNNKLNYVADQVVKPVVVNHQSLYDNRMN